MTETNVFGSRYWQRKCNRFEEYRSDSAETARCWLTPSAGTAQGKVPPYPPARTGLPDDLANYAEFVDALSPVATPIPEVLTYLSPPRRPQRACALQLALDGRGLSSRQ